MLEGGGEEGVNGVKHPVGRSATNLCLSVSRVNG